MRLLVSAKRTLNRSATAVFFGTIDSVLGEMAVYFSERNSKYMKALNTLDPGSENFLDAAKVKPLLDLMKTDMVESQLIVTRQFLQTRCTGQDGEKLTLDKLVSNYSSVFNAMLVVMIAFKHTLTFGASTAMCENSFSTLKNVFSEHSMLHRQKANLIQLAFERDWSRKFRAE